MLTFSHMLPDERHKRYREIVEDARREASVSNDSEREQFLYFAAQWDSLVGAEIVNATGQLNSV